MASYLDLAERSWPFLNRFFGLHTAVYKLSGGRVGRKLPGVPTMLLLDHEGAKSGKRRTTPLVYFEDPPNVVIVASKGGYPKHPAWFHNLKANPDTTVQIGTEHREVHARIATPAERDRLWPEAVKTWAGYADYQARTDREIPLVVLAPR